MHTSDLIRLPRRRREDSLGQRLALVRSCRSVGVPIEPATIGRFVVGRVLGRGGQGCVYEGFDPQLQRRVALKIPRYASGTDLAFEARALARVRHPHLVSVYALEICEGRPVVVMELVEGTPLLTWVRDQRPSARAIVDAAAAVGDGLAELHRCGLAHRDVKPGNVLMDERGQPRLVDLGLAAFAGESDGALGTPSFAAPEQLRGAAADPSADQYGLAATVRAAVTDSRRNRSELKRVAAALQRAGANQPTERFPDMAAFVRALRHRPRRRAVFFAVAGLATLGTALGLGVLDSGAPCRRDAHALRSGAWTDSRHAELQEHFAAMPDSIGAEAFAAAAEGMGDYSERWANAVSAVCESPAGQQWTGARAACLDDAAHQFGSVLDDLAGLDVYTAALAPELVSSLPAPQRCSQGEPTELEAAPTHEDSIVTRRRLSVALRRCRFRLTSDCSADLDAIERDATARDVDPCAWRPLALYERARGTQNVDDRASAMADAAAAAEICGQDGIRINVHRVLAEDAAMSGQDAAAAAQLRTAESILERVGTPASLHVSVLASRTSAMLAMGRAKEAVEPATRALQLHESLPGAAAEERSQLLGLLSSALHEVGDEVEARDLQHRALDLRRDVFGARHPSVAAELANLAVAYESADPARARVLNREAAEILSRHRQGHEFELAVVLTHAAGFDLDAGDTDQARADVASALALYRELEADANPFAADAMVVQAQLDADAGHLETARATATQAVTLLQHTRGSNDASTLGARLALAEIHEARGAPEQGRALRCHVHETWSAQFGREHPLSDTFTDEECES